VCWKHGHEVINPKLPDEDFTEAGKIAQAEFDMHQPQVVVGSSRGGAVAMNINSGSAKLVLLCPAWKKWGTAKTVKPGTVILHSRADDVIPVADSEELARNSRLPASALVEVGTDHRLAEKENVQCENKNSCLSASVSPSHQRIQAGTKGSIFHLCKIASKERRHLLDIGGSALFPKNLSALQR
jgi:hypothetical protein